MDEIDAIGGRRFSEGTSADREIQRTLMELLSQLDGFDVVGKVSKLGGQVSGVMFAMFGAMSRTFLKEALSLRSSPLVCSCDWYVGDAGWRGVHCSSKQRDMTKEQGTKGSSLRVPHSNGEHRRSGPCNSWIA